MKAIKHLQDRLVVVTVEARANPRLVPVAEAMRRTLECLIKAVR